MSESQKKAPAWPDHRDICTEKRGRVWDTHPHLPRPPMRWTWSSRGPGASR